MSENIRRLNINCVTKLLNNNMQNLEGVTKVREANEQLIEKKIVDQIFDAVVDQRLRPGTKLSEAALCEAFDVGRMHIRRALLLLASHEVVEIMPNRGAYIASPNEKQSRDVFEARLAMEPSVVKLSVARAKANDIADLEQHLAKEHEAHESGNREDAIRLSGAFHIMLAEIANNDVMLRTIKELVARSSLILSLYGAPGVSSCRDDDHSELLNSFHSNNASLAASIMHAHLHKILDCINLDLAKTKSVDLVSLFSKR